MQTTTFISHALANGRTPAEVCEAAGHANASITRGGEMTKRSGIYFRVIVGRSGCVFAYDGIPAELRKVATHYGSAVVGCGHAARLKARATRP